MEHGKIICYKKVSWDENNWQNLDPIVYNIVWYIRNNVFL